MSFVLTSSLSDAPNKHHLEGNKTSEVVRKSVNYVPEIWGDRFVALSPENLVRMNQGYCMAKHYTIYHSLLKVEFRETYPFYKHGMFRASEFQAGQDWLLIIYRSTYT